MCLPKLCPACFFRLHNLMFEAISVNFRLADFAPTLIYSQLVPLVQGIASWKQPLGLLSIIACCFQPEILTAERRLQKDYMSYFIAPPFPASTQPWMLLGEHQPFRLLSFSSFLQPVSKYYMTILSDAKNTSEKNFQCPLFRYYAKIKAISIDLWTTKINKLSHDFL